MKKKLILAAVMLLCICTVFTGCSDLTQLVDSQALTFSVDDGAATLKRVPDKSTVTEIFIPDEYEGKPVTKVADFAAVNLEFVTKIHIGKNVETIGEWAFENNKNITAFEVDEENEHFCDVDGVLYTKDMKTLLFYPLARGVDKENGITYEVPDGVETLRTKAFYKCTNLKSVTLPDSLTSIEEKVFFRCSLTGIELPAKLEFIGKDAFSYCTDIKSVIIPATVTQIGEYAFFNCTSVESVNVLAKQEEMTLGKKWYPTENGREMSKLEINWK